MTGKTRNAIISAAAVVIVVVIAGAFFYLRTAGSNREASVSNSDVPSDTFTFFGLGPATKLSDGLRDKLEDLLGEGSVETHTTIDLTMDDVTDFADHFPRLQALHDSLNYLPRQRVEHDTLQLTYRYARRQSVPFDRIQLVFSDKPKTPLFFSLYSKRDGDDFIASIQKKHGVPQTIGDEGATPRTLYWKKENELLIISITRNRIGFNEYNFGIYYLDNLTALAETERLAREAAEREKEKTGELAF